MSTQRGPGPPFYGKYCAKLLGSFLEDPSIDDAQPSNPSLPKVITRVASPSRPEGGLAPHFMVNTACSCLADAALRLVLG